MYPVFSGVSIADRMDTDLMNSKSGYIDFNSRSNTNLPINVAGKKTVFSKLIFTRF